MKCLVLIPCGQVSTPHTPDERARLSPGEEEAVRGPDGYLTFEADDLRSAIKLAARTRTGLRARAVKLSVNAVD